jgi:hypothetical protein
VYGTYLVPDDVPLVGSKRRTSSAVRTEAPPEAIRSM